jgi:polysaccharide export outer membrane protein
MRTVATILTLILFSCAACGGSPPPATSSSVTVKNDTTLDIGDTFNIRVYGEEGLSGTYGVAQDGTIDYPLIGRMEAAGKETTQLADEIETRLREKKILRNPQVSILMGERTSKRISVMGAVSNPGNYPISSGLTVVQVISLAGGLTSLASGNDTVVTRKSDDGKLQRFVVPVDDVTEGQAADFAVQAGDIIFIPERLF